MIRDIMPKSSTARLRRDFGEDELQARFDAELVSAVLGMSRAFMVRALDRPGTRPKVITLAEVVELLEVDGFQETFIPRSRIPDYLLKHSTIAPKSVPALRRSSRQIGDVRLEVGDARDLISGLDPGSVQCVVTSTPYWGMRVYDNDRDIHWADSENCPYGFEQTPEGFIRHTVELLLLLKPAIASKGSVWWNITDAHNTRTPIRGSTKERLNAMGEASGARKGWTEHDACRHSSGHRYLDDTELTSIPPRIAERASRIGYHFKSFITWRKHSVMPDSAKSRVSRQAEYILHLSVNRTPFFDKKSWRESEEKLGGPNKRFESTERITDVWSLPVSAGLNDHGAEFPLALAGRCISLSSKKNDLILDPFVGVGTTAVAALEMERRCFGFDISEKYIDKAVKRLTATNPQGRQLAFAGNSPDIESPSVNAS